MSDIPKARRILQELMESPRVGPHTKRQIGHALALMVRVKYCRRASAKRQVIDRKLRKRVRTLVQSTDKTMHEIADIVGLRSSGRISEVMHGQR